MKSYGEVVVADRIITSEVENSKQQKKVLQERFAWNIDKMTRKDIEDFEDYLRNEKTLSEKYPKQFESILEEYPAEINVVHTMVKLQDRGDNTIVKLKKKFKAFMQWLYETERTTNRPFDGIKIGVEKYGTHPLAELV